MAANRLARNPIAPSNEGLSIGPTILFYWNIGQQTTHYSKSKKRVETFLRLQMCIRMGYMDFHGGHEFN